MAGWSITKVVEVYPIQLLGVLSHIQHFILDICLMLQYFVGLGCFIGLGIWTVFGSDAQAHSIELWRELLKPKTQNINPDYIRLGQTSPI